MMGRFRILVINSGSSSIKYSLFDALKGRAAGLEDFVLLKKGLIERIGHRGTSVRNHKAGVELLLEKLRPEGLSAIGHRVVHGGTTFNRPTLITGRVLEKIRDCCALAPLHNPANLAGIEACQELLPGVRQVAIFDTAFHQTMSPHAYIYGLPYAYYKRYGLRRFGFHGTSHEYVAGEAARILKKPLSRLRLITCHLGNGCSITAIRNGKSLDTSMGFTPLEGLVMGTRCGDIDPASVIYLASREKLTLKEMDDVLNHHSGLKGISGVSNDMREIARAASAGNARARLAVEIFIYRIRKYLGAYAAVLGGVDAVVFTGGIGENQRAIRQRAVEGLTGLLGGRGIRVLVIPTNEELMIARQTYAYVCC